MDLLHTGSDGQLIRIKTESLVMTIKGSLYHPALSGVTASGKDASMEVKCEEDFDIAVTALGDAEKVDSGIRGDMFAADLRCRPLFYEQKNYELIVEYVGNVAGSGRAGAGANHVVDFWHENYNIRKEVTPIDNSLSSSGLIILSGIINFRNEIGFSDLVVRVDGRDYLTLKIEVFPSKISYKDDYKAIIDDVTSEVYNLAFDLLKRTYMPLDTSSAQQSSPVEFFAIIQKIYGDFIKAADMILHNPHHQLQTEHEVLPFHKVRRTDNSTVKWLEKHPEYVRKDVSAGKTTAIYRAERALAVRKYVTYDTKENRLTKYMLECTAQRLEHFKAQYCRLKQEADEELVRKINTMQQGINRRCNTGFMREVDSLAAKSGMSLVFGMAPGYRELFRCYLMLQHGLNLTGSIFNISIKDMAVLYEYWCFIKLNRLMKEKYELVSEDVVRVNSSGLYVALEKGVKSEVKYKNPRTGEKITLAYNRSEGKLPTVAQKPDNILTLEKKGAKVSYEYVFDAKYRIDPALPDSNYSKMDDAQTPGPMVEDINTMHRYRDAIVWHSGASPYERTMFGAYILFPYSNEEEYKKHRFYKSIEQVNIGGLPFLPSATGLVTELLDELVSDSPDSAFERATLPVGIEEKLAKVDWSRRDVLVGTLRGSEHLQWCLSEKAFLVAASRIKEENFPNRYVALYETESAFGDEAKIKYYGEVKTIEVVSGESDALRNAGRADTVGAATVDGDVTGDASQTSGLGMKKRSVVGLLKSGTAGAVPVAGGALVVDPDEQYYLLRVKSWKSLENPIKPKEKGFYQMYTNVFLLQNSSFVNELFLRSEEEYRLYSELKRRTDKASIAGDEQGGVSGFEVGTDGNMVMFEGGKIWTKVNGVKAEYCTVKEFADKPNMKFRGLMEYLRKLRGM